MKTWQKLVVGAAGIFLTAVGAMAWWCLSMPGESHRGAPPPPSDEQLALAERLRETVETLADEYGARGAHRPEVYREAESYLVDRLEAIGYDVEREDVPYRKETYHNLVVERRGTSRADEIVVVGAHYDTVQGSPGADDNASGVAGVLELARRWQQRARPERTLRFVLFANEEQPHFQTSTMGSMRHAERIEAGDDELVVMLSLEMLGYYSDAPGSQSYPAGLGWIYPERGNFIAFVGNLWSRGAVRTSIGAFRERANAPSQGLVAPEWVRGVGWSDHWAFWQAGYEALMVTDTAFFRNPHYHTPGDRPETLDYERFARVVGGLEAVVAAWANPDGRGRTR